MHQQRSLSCYYGLRKNPKKKNQRSPEPMKKILFRCRDCWKGFRYKKCLSNHQAVMHPSTNHMVCEESIKSLCSSSFSLVRKKKRSRVVRYKKTPLSCSFTTFLDEELEVAECLILLSKSSPKFVVDGVKLVGEAMDAVHERPDGCLTYKKLRRAAEFEFGFVNNDQKLEEEKVSRDGEWNEPALGGEFESRVLRNEQILVEEEISSGEEPASFLGRKRDLDQWKSCEFESDKRSVGVRGAMLRCDSDTERDERNVEHQCRLCNKVFSSYQSLGGHQTFHRMSTYKRKKYCREDSVEAEDEYAMEEKKKHSCCTCSRKFRSVRALCGHKKSHGKKRP